MSCYEQQFTSFRDSFHGYRWHRTYIAIVLTNDRNFEHQVQHHKSPKCYISLENALRKVTTPILTAESKETLDVIDDSHMSGKRFSQEIEPTLLEIFVRLDRKVHIQMVRGFAFVEDTIVWILGNTANLRNQAGMLQ